MAWSLATLPALAVLTACDGQPNCDANPELAGCPNPQAESGDSSADEGGSKEDGSNDEGADEAGEIDSGEADDSEAEDGETEDDGGAEGPGLEAELIDDMEDGDELILEVNGRQGYWYTYGDLSSGSLFPDPDEDFEMSKLSVPRGRSKAAVRVHGKGWTMEGAGFSFDLNEVRDHRRGQYDGAQPRKYETYDLSGYQGVQFWARRGDKGSDDTLRFSISDSQTDPRGGQCHECYNDWGIDLKLETEWTLVQVRFDDLAQDPSWGDLFEAFEPEEAFGMNFRTQRDSTFDVWIDDIALIPNQ